MIDGVYIYHHSEISKVKCFMGPKFHFSRLWRKKSGMWFHFERLKIKPLRVTCICYLPLNWFSANPQPDCLDKSPKWTSIWKTVSQNEHQYTFTAGLLGEQLNCWPKVGKKTWKTVAHARLKDKGNKFSRSSPLPKATSRTVPKTHSISALYFFFI